MYFNYVKGTFLSLDGNCIPSLIYRRNLWLVWVQITFFWKITCLSLFSPEYNVYSTRCDAEYKWERRRIFCRRSCDLPLSLCVKIKFDFSRITVMCSKLVAATMFNCLELKNCSVAAFSFSARENTFCRTSVWDDLKVVKFLYYPGEVIQASIQNRILKVQKIFFPRNPIVIRFSL